MSAPPTVEPLAECRIPALLAIWASHQERARRRTIDRAAWERPLNERQAYVERGIRAALRADAARALVATVGGEPTAYLIAHEVRLPRESGYRAYAPDRFLSIGVDDWGVVDPRDADHLAELYGALAAWGLRRGADAQMLAIATADDCADLWRDLGFARQDEYAFLPTSAARPSPDGIRVRPATPDDLGVATALTLAEAHHHHRAPIFAFAPPGLDAARRRDMAENLADREAIVLLAERSGTIVGGIVAHPIANLGRWMPSFTPTPCLYIESAYVEPQARGLGILRALVAALADRAGQRRLAGLFVTYLPANRGAAYAWRGLGFAPLVVIHQRRIDPRAARQHRSPENA